MQVLFQWICFPRVPVYVHTKYVECLVHMDVWELIHTAVVKYQTSQKPITYRIL